MNMNLTSATQEENTYDFRTRIQTLNREKGRVFVQCERGANESDDVQTKRKTTLYRWNLAVSPGRGYRELAVGANQRQTAESSTKKCTLVSHQRVKGQASARAKKGDVKGRERRRFPESGIEMTRRRARSGTAIPVSIARTSLFRTNVTTAAHSHYWTS